MTNDVRMTSIDVNMMLKKVRVFVHDHWEIVGDIQLHQRFDGGAFVMEMQMPDVQMWINVHREDNDGIVDWVEWGPRVN